MMLARIALARRMREAVCLSKLVNTVHDSIVTDSPVHEIKGVDSQGQPCYNIVSEMKGVFEKIPETYETVFKQKFNLPFSGEIKTIQGEKLA